MSESQGRELVPLRDLDAVSSGSAREGASEVGPGTQVTLNFALYLTSGEVVDSNFGKPPVTFVVGDGSLLPGFERELFGLGVGAQVDVLIPASQAFGPLNPDNQQRFPRYQFPPDLALSEHLFIEFADASGYKQAGRVVSIDARFVEIDFNHPLAGRDIRFVAAIHQVNAHGN